MLARMFSTMFPAMFSTTSPPTLPPFYRQHYRHTIEKKRKTYNLRFKYEICEKTTKITLKNGLNIDLGIIILI